VSFSRQEVKLNCWENGKYKTKQGQRAPNWETTGRTVWSCCHNASAVQSNTASLVIRLKPIRYGRSAVPLNCVYYMDSISSLLTPCLYVPPRTLTSFTTDVHTSNLFTFGHYTFTLGSRRSFSTTFSHVKWAIAHSSHLPSSFKQLSCVT